MKNSTALESRFQEPAGWQWGDFVNGRNKNLRYGHLAPDSMPLAHVIYVEGLSEYAEKTFEIAQDFTKENCHFWTYDRYGQGQSGRFLTDTFKQHSEGFDKDVEDLVQITKNIIPDDGLPVILLGHSTGGLISLMALHDHPGSFEAGILTSPLFGIKNPIVKGREGLFSRLPDRLLEMYVPGGGKWLPRTSIKSVLKPEDFSSDPVRNQIHDHWPENDNTLQIGAPTLGWIKSACTAIVKAKDPAYLSEIKKPVLLFTAGDDKLVVPTETFNIAAGLPNAELHNFEKGQHELSMEEDSIRKPLLQKSLAFIRKAKNTP